MNKNKMLCSGARVKMISDFSADKFYKRFYPPVGTLGTVDIIDNDETVSVFWDSDVKDIGRLSWFCGINDVEVIE